MVADKKIIEERVHAREEQPLGKMLAPQEPTVKTEIPRTEIPRKERKPVDIEDLRKAIEESLKDIST